MMPRQAARGGIHVLLAAAELITGKASIKVVTMEHPDGTPESGRRVLPRRGRLVTYPGGVQGDGRRPRHGEGTMTTRTVVCTRADGRRT